MKRKLRFAVLLLAAFIVLLGTFLHRRPALRQDDPVQGVPRDAATVPTQIGAGGTALAAKPAAGAQLEAPAARNVLSAMTAFTDWQGRFTVAQAGGQPADPALIDEGRGLAETRRLEMLKLMRANPWRALDQSLKWHEWTALPPEIQALVERPFSDMVDFNVSPDCRPVAARNSPWQTHRLEVRGTSYDAFVYGRRQVMTSKLGIPVQGIQLGGLAALWESPVQRLSAGDLAAAQKFFPDGNPQDRSWLTGQPIAGQVSAALVGGRVHYLASEEETYALAEAISGAEGLLGPHTVQRAWLAAGAPGGDVFNVAAFGDAAPKAASAWTLGPKTILCIRLDFTPPLGPPFTFGELVDQMNAISNQFLEMSFGGTWLVPTVTTQHFQLPHSQEYYQTNGQQHALVTTDARAMAAAAGYDLDSYDVLGFFFPSLYFGWSGLADRGGGNFWITGANPPRVAAHEIGHVYGLDHANYWNSALGTGFLGHTNYSGSIMKYMVEHDEYGDIFDIMGGRNESFPSGHFNSYSKAYLNWIDPAEVHRVTSSGRYRLYRFDHKDARTLAGTHLALQVINPDGEELWLGFRRNIPTYLSDPSLSAGLSTGPCIIWPVTPGWTRLIDATPLSRPNRPPIDDREDPALPPCHTYTDPSGHIRITNLGWGGTAPDQYVELEISLRTDAPAYELFTDFSRTTRGLTGSYVNKSLRGRTIQENWIGNPAVAIAGTRVDASVYFPTNGWGSRPVGLTHGSDADWEDFSVQWDGILVINRRIRLATKSDDGSRMWIDLNGDTYFATSGSEFINNHWGDAQAVYIGTPTATIAPGAYRIRIQYEEGAGKNSFALVSSEAQFDVFADAGAVTNGITGSYVNHSLRTYSTQDDWRTNQVISGRRLDPYLVFSESRWGDPTTVGVTGGTNNDWDNFSVQWDGYLRVYQPVRLATASDDGSRMWIDLNGDTNFASSGGEFINNHWGSIQGTTVGDRSTVVPPGFYRFRVQYEEGAGGNYFFLVGGPATVPVSDAGLRVYDGIATSRIACELPVGTNNLLSPIRINKNGTNYGIFLTDTNSPAASPIHVQTSSGTKAWAKLQ